MTIQPETIKSVFESTPFIILIGFSALMATTLYILSFSESMNKHYKRRRMKSRIEHMKDHYILVGFGRVGQQIAEELAREGTDFVIIEKEEAALDLAKEKNWAHIIGNAAIDESLFEQAHVDRAKCVIIAVGNDADAIFMAVSVRALNSSVFLVARASTAETAHKLENVGVNRVALPYQIGGYHMATIALRPSVIDFLDVLTGSRHDDLEMEEFIVDEKSKFIDKTLGDSEIIEPGLAVIALKRPKGKTMINPAKNTEMKAGDSIIVMGAKDKLDALTKELKRTGVKPQADTEVVESLE